MTIKQWIIKRWPWSIPTVIITLVACYVLLSMLYEIFSNIVD